MTIQYNTPITIEQAVDTVGASIGDPQHAWNTFATAFASVEVLSGREYVAHAAQVGERTYRLRTWQVAGVTNEMRVRITGGPTLQIIMVNDDWQHGIEMELICREIIQNG